MGFSGAEKVNLLLSLEESLGPREEDPGDNFSLWRLERAPRTAVMQTGTSWTANLKKEKKKNRKVSKMFRVIFSVTSGGRKHQVSSWSEGMWEIICEFWIFGFAWVYIIIANYI